jgi:hypothetical protein
MRNLKTVVLLLILVGGGYYGYRKFFAQPSDACRAYQKFAELMAYAKYNQAKAMTSGDATDAVEAAAAPISTPVGGGIDRAEMVNQIAGEVTGVSYSIESEVASDGGDKVTIAATQYVHRYRPGDRAVGGGVTNKVKHNVVLEREGSEWKVTSFEEKFIGNE